MADQSRSEIIKAKPVGQLGLEPGASLRQSSSSSSNNNNNNNRSRRKTKKKRARMSVKVACLCKSRDIKLFYTIKVGKEERQLSRAPIHLVH